MRNALGYEGKRVIVTAAAAGIGAATAELLIELGAEVHAIDREKPSYTGYASASECADGAQIAEAVKKIGHVVNALFDCAGAVAPDLVVPLMLDDSAIVRVGARVDAAVRSNAVQPGNALDGDVAWVLAFLNSPRARAISGATIELNQAR